MQNFPWSILIVGALVWFGAQQLPGPQPAPPPAPVPSGPNLAAVFAAAADKAQARQHAYALGEICTALADVLEWDARQATPRIKTGVQVDDLRTATRELRMRGQSFGTLYPQLGPEINGYLTAQVGTSGGPLDAAQRQRWITAFRGLGQAANYAAEQL